jgi:hydroxypyruvate reductase
VIARAECERLFARAVEACDPELLVRRELVRHAERHPIGLAIGKAALAMARGAGAIGRGIAVAPRDDGAPLPAGWELMVGAHPRPDERSLEAGDAVIDLIAGARAGDRVLALISGGASALCERLAPGVALGEFNAEIDALVARGAPIPEINLRRQQLSAIKGGKLADMCDAPIDTLAISDVPVDSLYYIGSGPTISLRHPYSFKIVIANRDAFARVIAESLSCERLREPIDLDVTEAADRCTNEGYWHRPLVAWGEPTLRVPPDHGEGGRAQQLALEIAKRVRGRDRAALVAGSDGIDGPPPRDRPAPAGAYVDGGTWDGIARAGIDPQRALDRRDAGTALHAVGALFVPGPTGINHADVAIVG